MADIQPLRALRYDPSVAGPLQNLIAPPYDVIDADQRAELVARSPHNVVNIDLPEAPLGGDAYEEAARLLDLWRRRGAVVRDREPAMWVLEQDYRGPDGRPRTRRGFLARVRIEDYGPGRIRPHERTHPGPKEDRLRLTRATGCNLSPIFSLYDDPAGAALGALDAQVSGDPWGAATDHEGTTHRLWRVADPAAVARVTMALTGVELLIADGHHRYETARVYAEEVGGDGEAGYVLMYLVPFQDPGLTIFPTHRLLSDVKDPSVQERLGAYLKEHFEIEEVGLEELGAGGIRSNRAQPTFGYLDAHFKVPYRLTLKDPAIADRALADHPEPYRRLDTAILEALILRGVLGMTEDDIAELRGLGYSRTDDEARRAVLSGASDCAFFLAPSPVRQVQEIAAAGATMPPKSTFFFPKVPTGLMFNPLG
jgi:uncharacterized protein (DUF1015 family)